MGGGRERMTECVTERERGVSRVCGGQGERD